MRFDIRSFAVLGLVGTHRTCSFKMEIFEIYMERKEDQSHIQLHMEEEVNFYLERDIHYKKKQLELSYFKWNPVLRPMPVFRYDPQDKIMSWEWDFSAIFESFFSFLLNADLQKAHYNLKEHRQKATFKVQELMKRFLELISEIRAEYRVYLYLNAQLEAKQKLNNILEEDDLNDLFTLRHNLLSVMEKLYKLHNELETLTLENREYFSRANITKLTGLFNNNNVSYKACSVKYIPVPATDILSTLTKKLPVKFIFNKNIIMGSTHHISIPHSWKFVINPAEYLKHIVTSYYNNKQSKMEEKFQKQQWKVRAELHEDRKKFYKNKLQNIIKNLKFMLEILNNQDMLQSIKPKNIWEHNSHLIRKEEEKILVEILIYVHSLIVFD